MATTAFCNSAKVELLQAAHCFNAIQSGVSCTANTTNLVTGLASTAGLSVGMPATGANVPANTFIANITGATTLTLSNATTGACSSLTFTADSFYMSLIKVSPTRTFDGTQTNAGTPGSGSPTTSNIGTDETSGTGYTANGQLLVNVTPSLSSTVGITTFSNPSWTSASFSCTAGVIYNSTTRLGAAAAPLNNRTISVHDFGGTQTVSSGTLTVVMPTANSSTAILRLA